jgi:hypothetical protein
MRVDVPDAIRLRSAEQMQKPSGTDWTDWTDYNGSLRTHFDIVSAFNFQMMFSGRTD